MDDRELYAPRLYLGQNTSYTTNIQNQSVCDNLHFRSTKEHIEPATDPDASKPAALVEPFLGEIE